MSATDANDCDDVGGETRAEYSPPAQLSSRRVVNGVKFHNVQRRLLLLGPMSSFTVTNLVRHAQQAFKHGK